MRERGYFPSLGDEVNVPGASEPAKGVFGRFHAQAEDFGFSAPPAGLRLKLLRAGDHWTLFVQVAEESAVQDVLGWLHASGPQRLEFGSRNIVRADYAPLPPRWDSAFAGVQMEMMRLAQNGEATVDVVGTRTAVAAFGRRLYGDKVPLELVTLRTPTEVVKLLTTPQDEALRAAVAYGYYKIPRLLNLHDLAEKLQISPASLSERLRRAEGRIIVRYVDAGAKSPWDEKTLFDASPLDARAREGFDGVFPTEREVRE
jgi:hypothetical protein